MGCLICSVVFTASKISRLFDYFLSGVLIFWALPVARAIRSARHFAPIANAVTQRFVPRRKLRIREPCWMLSSKLFFQFSMAALSRPPKQIYPCSLQSHYGKPASFLNSQTKIQYTNQKAKHGHSRRQNTQIKRLRIQSLFF